MQRASLCCEATLERMLKMVVFGFLAILGALNLGASPSYQSTHCAPFPVGDLAGEYMQGGRSENAEIQSAVQLISRANQHVVGWIYIDQYANRWVQLAWKTDKRTFDYFRVPYRREGPTNQRGPDYSTVVFLPTSRQLPNDLEARGCEPH